MAYSQLYLKDRFKIPTIISLIFVFILIIFFARFFTKASLPSRASNITLKRVEVVNLSPYQAAIYWQTDTRQTGWVMLGDKENQMNRVFNDERDVSNDRSQYINHYAVLRNLKDNRQYFYKIICNNKLVGNDGKAFTFTTPASNSPVSNLSPAYGKVVKSNGQPLENAVILVSVANNNPLAALTKATGEWLVSLNYIKTTSAREPAKIEVISEDGEISTVTADLSQLSPLPQTIVMGKNYNFSAEATNVLGSETTGTAKNTIAIIYPLKDKPIPGTIPIIKGTAMPNSDISITVHSDKTYSARVKSDSNGNWQYTLPEGLSFGQHTITITTRDENGKEVTLKRDFVMQNDVLGAATSAAVVSGAPVITVTPTVTVLPTYPLTPTSMAVSTASPSAPVSGTNGFIMPALGGASLIIVGMGVILAF